MMIRTLVLWMFGASALAASPWTYRGQLQDGGVPANGRYDLRLTLLDEQQDQPALAPLTLYDVEVVDGRFAAAADFGVSLDHTPVLRLRTEVRPAGGGRFDPLGDPVRFDAKAIAGGQCWALDGNAGVLPTQFLGTVDATPLNLNVQGVRGLSIQPNSLVTGGNPATTNTIAGSYGNTVDAGVRGATISGGGIPSELFDPDVNATGPNRVSDAYGTIGGGFSNMAGNGFGSIVDSRAATVGGGSRNSARGAFSTIGGGLSNVAGTGFAAVLGGQANDAAGVSSVVGGGEGNAATGLNSTVSGGARNCAGGVASWAGGSGAKVRPGSSSGIGGACHGIGTNGANGDANTFVWADGTAASFISSAPNQFLVRAQGGMGLGNNAPQAMLHVERSENAVPAALARFESTAPFAPALVSVIAAGSQTAGLNLFTSTTDLRGTISASGADSGLTVSAPDNIQLSLTGGSRAVLFPGGLSLLRGGTALPAGRAIQVGTSSSNGNGAHLTNAGVWTSASSREFKHAFEAVDPGHILERLLELPITHWRYQGEDGVQHLGPVAEDFRDAFGLGHDERYIGSVDADGVALAAIQGLNAKLEAENAQLRQRLEAENAQLRQRLDALEARLQSH